MTTTYKIPVELHLEVDTEADAYDGANEILREQQRKYVGNASCLLDYSFGKAKKVESWRDRIIEALDGYNDDLRPSTLEAMADEILELVGKHLPDPNEPEPEDV